MIAENEVKCQEHEVKCQESFNLPSDSHLWIMRVQCICSSARGPTPALAGISQPAKRLTFINHVCNMYILICPWPIHQRWQKSLNLPTDSHLWITCTTCICSFARGLHQRWHVSVNEYAWALTANAQAPHASAGVTLGQRSPTLFAATGQPTCSWFSFSAEQ